MTTGESGLYNQSSDLEPNMKGLKFILCEECFLGEEELVDERGTNNIPERIQHYFETVGYDHT